MTTITEPKFFLIDAEGQVLGKVAERAAVLIRGKHKVDFDPAKDCGDTVIIINAEKVVVSGNKELEKAYVTHSQYPGGFKATKLSKYRVEQPEKIFYLAVKGMLPKNRSREDKLMKHLKVYAGAVHPHEAQKPETLKINY